MWCDFFYLCSRLNCLCIMGHSFILYLVNRVFHWKVLCALYIKRLNLWCHLYDNSTSLVINGRKSFFLYICVCFVCISHTYHASFYTLHITLTLQSCACCFLMQFFFFLQKFNSNKWCYLFQLKIFASCCVFFCVAMQCNCFHFYRVFVCFDTNLQINFTQFSGKILDITRISVLIFFPFSENE